MAWGMWEQSAGMTGHLSDIDQARISRSGVRPLSTAQGMDLFDAALRADHALMVPIRLDLPALRALAASGRGIPALLRGQVRVARRTARSALSESDRRRFIEGLAGMPPAQLVEGLMDLVRVQVLAVLGYSGDHHIAPDEGLFEMGFDSLSALELRNRLSEQVDTKLSPGLVFEYPTVRMIAEHMYECLYGEDPADIADVLA